MNNQVYDFLKKHNMSSDLLDMQTACQNFIEQMKSGLEGNIKSLLMIPAYVGAEGEISSDKKVIVLDAGGTNLRSACVHFDKDKKPIIEGFNKIPMLGTQGEISKEEFYNSLADLIAPFDSQSDTVGFCFSFPTEILPNCDGKLINFNKEVKVRDMKGEIIGQGINNALIAKGLSPKKFCIINDTVATMLGGMVACPSEQFDSYIGFILGTGTNTCYIEDNKNIKKLSGLKDGCMAINMETGSFDGFVQGDIDKQFDSTTANEGDHIYEKMVSGAYQAKVILLTLKTAAKEGLFTQKTAENILATDDITMYMVDLFSENPNPDNPIANLADTEEDRQKMFDIVDDSFERAAKMVCVNLGAIMLCTNRGKSPDKPVCVSAEGTTFYKSVLFRPKLDKYIEQFLNKENGVWCRFVKAEDATLIGSAVAGLML